MQAELNGEERKQIRTWGNKIEAVKGRSLTEMRLKT
jgi:hypothetical protein